MYKRVFAAVLTVSLLLTTGVSFAQEKRVGAIPDSTTFSIQAKGAIVMEPETGRILFAQGAQEQLAMASTTKIMTTLITLEQENRDEYFVVDTDAIHVEGSSMGLQEGDQVTLNALAHGMLLTSGNDSANAAAVRIAGSMDAFADLMNARAAEIGMVDTHFVTPSGLDAEGHYTTAYDMALLAWEALQNPDFAAICSEEKLSVEFGNPPYLRSLSNHNRLLKIYDYAIGVKTGFTDDAGRCLVSAAQKDGTTLIIVTLGAADDFNTHMHLYERFFDELQMVDVTEELLDIFIPITGGELEEVLAVPSRDMVALVLESEEETLTRVVEAPKFLYAPVKKGDIIGSVKLYADGQLVYDSPILSAKDVSRDPENMGPLGKFWHFVTKKR